MNDQTDSQLLSAWAKTRSEPAFAELVRRHVDFVHSAALRMVCDSHLAKDVTQSVFVALAKDAARITDCRVLAGWLHRTAQNIAAQTVRTDMRRRAREQEAATMNELLATEPDLSRRSETEMDAWEHIAPHLDAALGELSGPDRDAVLLRYFENKSLREVGQALGTSDDTAQKRVSRAVERLREFLAKRGVTVGASGLAVVISANAVQAAPVGLAVTISTAAALAGTTIAATATATTVKTIAMTTLQKTVIGTALVASVVTPLFIQHRALVKARVEQSMLLAEMRNFPIQTATTFPAGDTDDRARRERTELESLRREVVTLRERISELSKHTQQLAAANPSQKVTGTPIGETLRLADVHDAGQATPAALLQTHSWAMLRGDTNRLAQLMVVSPETDMLKVQRQFEAMSKEATKGINVILAELRLSEIRLLEEQPAENNDRWVVHESVNKDGSVARRARIRVRPTAAGWKLVIGSDGQTETETVDEQP